MTRNFTIVGGIYLEHCIQAPWHVVMGSGGRAAQAVAHIVRGRLTLASFVFPRYHAEAERLAGECEAKLLAFDARHGVAFHYLHSLSTPKIIPPPTRMHIHEPITVNDDVVLRYGMLEGDAIVHADIAVYDPQSAFGAARFGANGSSAERLAVVMNQSEALSMTGKVKPDEAAASLLDTGEAEVVIIKMGGRGALVVTKKETRIIPAYKTKFVWKLGSGDVFSSTFAAYWGCEGLDPFIAAEAASRATACYCETRSLPGPDFDELMRRDHPPVAPGSGRVYLAAPFFDLGQRWLVEETRTLLRDLGAEVFSPIHDVGPGLADLVAPRDLAGLETADVVFAILNGRDPGTLFEVGYARKRGLPVVAFAQNVTAEDLKMVVGSGSDVVDDFVTALYRTIWSLPPA